MNKFDYCWPRKLFKNIKDVYVLSPLHDFHQSNVTIMFNSSGIGINVECDHGLLHIRASVSPSFFVYKYFF